MTCFKLLKMKKIFLLLLTVIMFNNSFAQHAGSKVDFKDVDLEMAIEMAKQNNLLIYCNFSTSWCGPCKTLFADVYCDQQVGDLMNKKFISLYIDAEAKEWIEVTKKFKIGGFPTMIILDATGKEKARMMGAMSKSKFLEELAKNLDDTRTPEGLKNRYEAGERSPELINDYAYLMMKNGDEKTGYEIVNNYFNSLSDTQKEAKENWFLYKIFATDLNDIKANYLIDNYKHFYNTVGQKDVEERVYRLLRLDIAGYVSGYQNRNNIFVQADFDRVIRFINSVDIAGESQLLSVIRVAKARVKCETNDGDNFSSFMKVCKEEFDKLDKMDCSIMVSNFGSLSLVASDKVKKEAISLIQKYQALYEPEGEKGIDILGKTIAALQPVKRGNPIDFKSLSFDEALKIAARENKLVFIDCFTDWCEPCKVLSAEVFTAKIVKDYFDKNFINLKIDMEKGEGPTLAKRFKIKGYPTLLLIDGQGNIVHEKVGSSTVEPFLNEFKKANETFFSK